MNDWLVIELTCPAELARKLGARRERRTLPRSDVVHISDRTGRLWFWDMGRELLEVESELSPPADRG
jgi:hypothetical protein